jgi:hypothetical protein
MGSDQYQLHSAEAIRRFWALGLCLYQYLDSVRHRLERLHKRHVTLGETLTWLRERHDKLALRCACDLAAKGVSSTTIQATFTPALKPLLVTNC